MVFVGAKRIEVSASLCCWLLWNNIFGKWKEERVSFLNLPYNLLDSYSIIVNLYTTKMWMLFSATNLVVN
jgi:hypothetical protein